jgi:hypothetical protein
MKNQTPPCIRERSATQATSSAKRTPIYALPDPVRRRRLVEAVHRELGHLNSALPALLTEVEVARVLKGIVGTLRNRRQAHSPLPRHVTVGRSAMYKAEDVADVILGTPLDLSHPSRSSRGP